METMKTAYFVVRSETKRLELQSASVVKPLGVLFSQEYCTLKRSCRENDTN